MQSYQILCNPKSYVYIFNIMLFYERINKYFYAISRIDNFSDKSVVNKFVLHFFLLIEISAISHICYKTLIGLLLRLID